MSAVELLAHKGFNGIPVINRDNQLLGLLTQHDMMLRGTDLHLPTLIRVLTDVSTYGKDKKFVSPEMQHLSEMKMGDVMNTNPLTLSPDQPVEDALQVFATHHDVNPILIVDEDNALVGVLSRFDMIKLFVPDEHTEHFFAQPERPIDQKLKKNLSIFERRFMFVSRMRTHHWLWVSFGMFLVGFCAAFLVMLRLV